MMVPVVIGMLATVICAFFDMMVVMVLLVLMLLLRLLFVMVVIISDVSRQKTTDWQHHFLQHVGVNVSNRSLIQGNRNIASCRC